MVVVILCYEIAHDTNLHDPSKRLTFPAHACSLSQNQNLLWLFGRMQYYIFSLIPRRLLYGMQQALRRLVNGVRLYAVK